MRTTVKDRGNDSEGRSHEGRKPSKDGKSKDGDRKKQKTRTPYASSPEPTCLRALKLPYPTVPT